MATVKWAFLDDTTRYPADIVAALVDVEPKRVLPMVLDDLKRAYATAPSGDGMYGKCYAFLDYFKNVYAICAPVDMELVINEHGAVVETKLGGNSAALRGLIQFRSTPDASTNILLTISYQYTFFSPAEVMIEQLPPFMDYTLMMQGVTVIPGTYDISKWVRPIEVPLEIAQGVRSVVIPAGAPLTYVRFMPKDGSTVELNRVENTPELNKVIKVCTGLKALRTKTPLKQCYETAKKVVDAFVRPKRCPFGFGGK